MGARAAGIAAGGGGRSVCPVSVPRPSRLAGSIRPFHLGLPFVPDTVAPVTQVSRRTLSYRWQGAEANPEREPGVVRTGADRATGFTNRSRKRATTPGAPLQEDMEEVFDAGHGVRSRRVGGRSGLRVVFSGSGFSQVCREPTRKERPNVQEPCYRC